MLSPEDENLRRMFDAPSIDEPSATEMVELHLRMPRWIALEIETNQKLLGARDKGDVIGRSIHWVSYGIRLANDGYEIDIKKNGEVVDSMTNEELRAAWYLLDSQNPQQQ